MKLTIAGYGAIGHYIEEVFGRRHEIDVYDPPLGFGDDAVLRTCDFVFVCVPTPMGEGGACDTSLVEDVVARSDPSQAIVCESTVPVGTTDRLIERYRKPLVFVPEYAGESPTHPLRDPAAREFFIYGGYDPAASRVRDLFLSVYPATADHVVVQPAEAEMAKYMENAFLALKVTFSNEFYDLCNRLGIDYTTVRDLWTLDSRIGRSHTEVTPERGYGGKCLPKDVAAINALARAAGSPLELMEAAQAVNRRLRAGD